MRKEHYTIEDYSNLFHGEADWEKQELLLEHLEVCDLCKVKMKAATLLTLMEDDEVLNIAVKLAMNVNRDKSKNENLNKNEEVDADEDLD